MNLGFLTEEIKIDSRKLLAVIILVSGSLAWSFFMVFAFETIFVNFVSDPFPVYLGQALFLSFGAISAIVGSVISERVNRKKLLLLWITMGAITSFFPAMFSVMEFVVISSVILGVSLGLGYPSFTAFLADCTEMEERARISGLVIVVTFIVVISAIVFVLLLNLGLLGVVMVGVSLKLSSYLGLVLVPCKREEGKKKTWRSVLEHKDFSFYLTPWLMFNIATGLIPFIVLGLTPAYKTAYANAYLLHYLGTGVAAFMGGFYADRVGRKQPIMIGMIMLGISFGFLGLATSELSLLVYQTISGIAWGFLIVIYLAVPGDLSLPGSKEKFYALGIVLPLIIYAGLSSASPLLNIAAPVSLSAVLMIIIFLSIIPVLRAKETLSEEIIRKRRMEEHLKKIGKLVLESKKNK